MKQTHAGMVSARLKREGFKVASTQRMRTNSVDYSIIVHPHREHPVDTAAITHIAETVTGAACCVDALSDHRIAVY